MITQCWRNHQQSLCFRHHCSAVEHTVELSLFSFPAINSPSLPPRLPPCPPGSCGACESFSLWSWRWSTTQRTGSQWHHTPPWICVSVEGGRQKVTPLVTVTHYLSHPPSSLCESDLIVVVCVWCTANPQICGLYLKKRLCYCLIEVLDLVCFGQKEANSNSMECSTEKVLIFDDSFCNKCYECCEKKHVHEQNS